MSQEVPSQGAVAEKTPKIPVNPTFVSFVCFSLDPAFRRLNEAEKKRGVQAFERELGFERAGVDYRLYLSIGLRHDTDFFLWVITKDMAALQPFTADLLKSGFGHYLKMRHLFLAMTRPSQYNPGHIPAFEMQERGRKYLFLYPFVKSRGWYLLPFEKRREMMRGHMDIGQTYPMVRLNTTYSFGLGDQDFVLAFETDEPAAFEDLVQQLRETEASRYTVRDTPFILGTWCNNVNVLTTGLGL